MDFLYYKLVRFYQLIQIQVVIYISERDVRHLKVRLKSNA